MDLKDRVALVTGVGRRAGIGAAIARELAQAGAKVFVSFLRRYDEAQSWGGDAAMPEALLQELRSHARGRCMRAGSVRADGARVAVRGRAAALRTGGHPGQQHRPLGGWRHRAGRRVPAGSPLRGQRPGPRCSCVPSSSVTRSNGSPGRIVNITSGQGLGPMPVELAYAVTKAALDVLTGRSARNLPIDRSP